MARGNEIIVSAQPGGKFQEGFIASGITPKPGTVMQLKADGSEVGGRFEYELYAPGADGDRKTPLVLLPDQLQGKLATDAYAAGERCFLYIPQRGDELNVRLKDVAGTADDIAFADMLIVDHSTGHVIKTTGTPETEMFQALEAVVDPTEEQLIHVQYTGY